MTARVVGATAANDLVLPVAGRFDLEFAGRFLRGWPPATHSGRSADGALRLAFVTDDMTSVAGVAVRPARSGGLHATFTDPATAALVAQVRRILSLDLDGAAFDALGRRNDALGRLQARSAGARPVLFASPYEAAVWAVLSARTPAARAAHLRRELMARHGGVLDVDGETLPTLPIPRRLLAVDALPGTPAEKIRRLHGVAQAAIDGVLDAAALTALAPGELIGRLKSIRGIGDFYATLIAGRAIGAALIPAGERRLLAAAGDLVGADGPLTEAEFGLLASDWQPFHGWAAFLLRAT